jgi:putative endonuclease
MSDEFPHPAFPPSAPRPTRRSIGNGFENRAAEYLRAQGYRILERNRVYPWGEIDIIAEEEFESPFRGKVRALVFVEVRGSVDGGWVTPAESILPKKAARLRRAIETYLLFYKGNATDVRVDLITVEGDEEPVHLPDYIQL